LLISRDSDERTIGSCAQKSTGAAKKVCHRRKPAGSISALAPLEMGNRFGNCGRGRKEGVAIRALAKGTKRA